MVRGRPPATVPIDAECGRSKHGERYISLCIHVLILVESHQQRLIVVLRGLLAEALELSLPVSPTRRGVSQALKHTQAESKHLVL